MGYRREGVDGGIITAPITSPLGLVDTTPAASVEAVRRHALHVVGLLREADDRHAEGDYGIDGLLQEALQGMDELLEALGS